MFLASLSKNSQMAIPAKIPVIKPPKWPQLSTLESAFGPTFRFSRISIDVKKIRYSL